MARPGTRREVTFNQSRRSYQGRLTVSSDLDALQKQCAIYQAEHDAAREAQRREVFGY